MKKKCMAIAKKVMVWSLAASMLVATPLTASATGLNKVYKIEDNAGNVIGNEDVSRTGTVSSTSSKSHVLDNETKIAGIVLSETEVNLSMNDGKKNDTKVLTAEILTNGDDITPEELEILNRSFNWRSSNTQVVAVENLAKTNSAKRTDKMQLNAKAGGDAKVTVSLDNEEFNVHFTATVNVSVKEYATELKFKETVIPNHPDEKGFRRGYVKHTVDLNEALEITPTTANDEITFAIVGGDKNVAAIDKKGVLTYKKTGTVKIIAIGERKSSEVVSIKIEEGTPANKVEIWLDKAGETKKAAAQKLDVSVNEQRELEVVAKLYAKGAKVAMTDEERNGCTDLVVWESNKPAIVKVTGTGDKVTLVPTGVGKATITAKTSTGKKATLSVTVSATMTDIKITTAKQDIYAGQTLVLEADRYFGAGAEYVNFPGSDSVTWFLVDNATDKKYAGIKKNVFTAKTTVADGATIKVSVKSAKKYNKVVLESNDTLELTTKQADVQKIEVQDVTEGTVVATPKQSGTKGTIIINAGNNRKLMITATGSDGKTVIPDTTIPLATTLNVGINNEKFATVAQNKTDGSATVTAKDVKGKATITVSGTQLNKGKYKAIKASFKADVRTPAKSIQLAFKKKVVQATNKNQTVSVTATLPKGTTTNAKNIQWKATVKKADGSAPVVITGIKNGKSGSIKLAATDYVAGDEIIVSASVKESQNGGDDRTTVSASSTIRIPVVKPSKGVGIYSGLNSDTDPVAFTKNKTDLTVGSKLNITARVNTSATKVPAFENPWKDLGVANVTYSVSKKGIVSIVDGEVTGIMPGTVKITATTSDGKKATLTVKVVE